MTASHFLNELFQKKRAKNPKYSLRSFAKACGVSAGFMSSIFSGQKRLSLKTGLEISKNLQLSPAKAEFLKQACELDQVQQAKNFDQYLRQAENALQEKKFFPLDDSLAISDEVWKKAFEHWYDWALLECSPYLNSDNNIQLISKEFGLSPVTVIESLHRLLDAGLLTKERSNGQGP